MEHNKTRRHSDVVDRNEKIEATLDRLQSLKYKVSKLRLQLEALKESAIREKTGERVAVQLLWQDNTKGKRNHG